MPSQQFELLLWGISSRFPLVNYFDLCDSQIKPHKSIFGISQDPRVCAHTSLSHGVYHKGMWVGNNPWHISLWPPRSLFCTCVVRKVSRLRQKNMWSRQSPAFSLNCPAILFLEFQSIGNESFIALRCEGTGEHLPPALAPLGEQLPKIFRIIVICLWLIVYISYFEKTSHKMKFVWD